VVAFHVEEAGECRRQAEAGGVAGVDAGQQRLDHAGVRLGAETAGEELGHGLFGGRRPGPAVVAGGAVSRDDDVAEQAGRSGR
jgi:hypothetical protein